MNCVTSKQWKHTQIAYVSIAVSFATLQIERQEIAFPWFLRKPIDGWPVGVISFHWCLDKIMSEIARYISMGFSETHVTRVFSGVPGS